MPKRKYDCFSRRLKQLEENLRKRRRRIIISDSSSSSDDENVQRPKNTEVAVTASVIAPPEMENDKLPSDSLDSPDVENFAGVPAPVTEYQIDPDLLVALGESTPDTPDFGEKIHENLSNLWTPILRKGLAIDNKEKLIKEYPIPDNCRLLQAPKLNAEISAAVPDLVRNRDKSLSVFQQQLGAGITAVNRSLDLMLKRDNKSDSSLSPAIKHLSNGCRILSDLHFANTQSRIKLVTPSLDKTFLHVIQDAQRDDTIFGIELSNKIKAAKAIEKQGLQIKKATSQKLPALASSQPSGSRPAYQGNWTAPPRYPSNRGGRGGARRPPATARRFYNAPPPAKPASQSKPRAATAHR